MRTSFIILAATLLMTAFPAQAQTSERRLLTMEDVILNRELTPKNFSASWIGQSDSYAWVDGTTLCATDARNNKRRTIISLDELNSILATSFKSFPAYTFDDEQSLVVAAFGMRNTIDLKSRTVTSKHKIPAGQNLTRQSGKGGIYAYTRDNNLYCFVNEREQAITSYSDLRFAFAQPEASLSMNVSYVDGVYTVEITNNSQYISYMNILKVKDAEGNLVIPAYWSDNFFPLLPGQTKTVTCKVAKAGLVIERG
jgi:hypothetical protein